MHSVVFVYPLPKSTFEVVVDNTTDSIIDVLWQQARTKAPSLADHIGGAWCKFYIPSDLSLHPSATLLPRSRDWLRQHRDDGPRVLSYDVVSNGFPSMTPPDMVLVLVVTQELLDGLDDLGDLATLALKQRGKGIKSFLNSFPSPSTGVSSYIGVERIVNHDRDNFHAGRPAGNFGPPVSLFNPALGLFDHRLRHLDHECSIIDLPPSLIQLAHMFMVVAANSYPDEHTWASTIKDILNQIFPATLNWEAAQTRFGIKPGAINFGDNPFFVVEVKNEAGLEGDASLEAALSYAHIATSPVDTDSRRPSNYPAMLSNYPSVLYGIMGNLLEIGVATYTDGPYYSLLFSERLHLGFHAAKNILRLARAFAATRHVIADLTEFYTVALPAPGSIAHLFPSPLPLTTYTDPVPSLTFTRRLSPSGEAVVLARDEITRQSGIYLATMARPRSANEDEDMVTSSSGDTLADTSEVVVKFTEQYHPEAHRLLATEGFAPVLHACVPVCGDLFMVVMDRVHGKTAWLASSKGELLPYDVFKDIEDAILLLHSHNLVFGDLRPPNIMVSSGGSGLDTRSRGMLIDFDWVGTHGIGRYPASLDNGLLDWASSGVQRCAIMDKAHDLAMLRKFKDKCYSV